MEIGSIGAVETNSSPELQRAGLGQEEFLRILLTQLSFQDPLEPMDNQEFIAQMAQFTALEQTNQFNDKLDNLLTIQTTSQSLGLLNKTVELNTNSGTEVGEISSVRFEQGIPLMTVKKSNGEFLTDISLSQVKLVREPQE